MAKKRPRTLSHAQSLSARSIKPVRQALRAAVLRFVDEGRFRFRGRVLSAEAFVNAAVWYAAELDRAGQEAILAAYLPRLEGYLLGADVPPAPPGPPPAPLPPASDLGPSILDPDRLDHGGRPED